jgi:3-oxoacyl-[acyl-carrier-protein] synthase II
MELGTMGAFLVLEEKQHAQKRGAKPFARLASIQSNHVTRTPGAITAVLDRMWFGVGAKVKPENAAFISGATGIEPITAEERAFLGEHSGLAVRATGTHLGHGLEPQFPANVALAAIALRYGPGDASGVERAMEAPLRQVVITTIGHWRGECLALLEAAE